MREPGDHPERSAATRGNGRSRFARRVHKQASRPAMRAVAWRLPIESAMPELAFILALLAVVFAITLILLDRNDRRH